MCTQELLHRRAVELLLGRAFTQRRFSTEEHLHRDTFTQKSFYTKKRLHRRTFTDRSFYAEDRLHTGERLHTGAFTQKSVYTEKLLHRNPFAHTSFYTANRLHTGAYFRRTFSRYDLKMTIYLNSVSWTSNFISCKKGCQHALKIAILPQFLDIEAHFRGTSHEASLKIAIFPHFLDIEPHFVRKGCDSQTRLALPCRLRDN